MAENISKEQINISNEQDLESEIEAIKKKRQDMLVDVVVINEKSRALEKELLELKTKRSEILQEYHDLLNKEVELAVKMRKDT